MLLCIHNKDNKYYHDNIIKSKVDLLILIGCKQE